MIAQFENFNLHVTKASGKNRLEALVKDESGHAAASHTFQYYADPFVLSKLEDSLGKNVRETSALIEKFGRELYNAVFAGEIAGYYKSLQKGNKDIRLKLIFKQDEPELLRLPWEFMFDGTNFLSAYPRLTMSRSLDGAPVAKRTPIEGKIRILAVVSSPLDLKDFQRLQIEQEQLNILQSVDRVYAENKVEIEFLDEASLKNIQARLDEEEYHILHYTGHGVYSEKEDTGYLLLEDDSGKSRATDNKTIANLLAGYDSLRLVFLSGCQTAKTSGRKALSDLATPLLLNGIPAVVAMQYSVSDGSAMALAMKFYSEIGSGAPVDLALTRARKELLLSENIGKVEFATPVLFAGDPDCLTVAAEKPKSEAVGIGFGKPVSIEPRVALGLEQLGKQFIGRRRELRRIKEDFLARGIRVVVLHGIGGIGKTVTATQIAEKLRDNFAGIYAFDCREGLTIEEILLQFNEFLKRIGVDALDQYVTASIPIAEKVGYLAQVLSQVKLLVIFDNFETLLSEERDRREIANPELKKGLNALVKQCKDGTRFLITSRYTFNLTDGRLTNVIDEINLGELSQPEAIMVMNRFPDILTEDFATKIEIFDKIGGHPYYINIFARHASHASVEEVLSDLSSVHGKMIEFTLLDKSYQKLGERARKIIDGSAIFKKAVRQSGLQWMAKRNSELPDISNELEELIHWGLIIRIEEDSEAFYQVHMLVRDFVRRIAKDNEWKQHQITGAQYYEDLVDTTHDIWDYLDARELYFDAKKFDRAGVIVADVQAVLRRWGFMELVRKLCQETINTASGSTKAAALLNLGNLHFVQGDYEQALEKYTQVLKIFEGLGDEQNKSATLHQLGMIHQNQGDYDQAIEKYSQSMKIKEELGDKRGIAPTLHQLGRIHQLQGEYAKAIEKYTQSMKISEELGDKEGIAYTLGQLGTIHKDQSEYDQAIEKYSECMKIFEELGDKRSIAVTLHQLGMIHQDQGDFEQALEKYTESLKIAEALGDKGGIAITLHQLGIIHQEQGDYDQAIEKYSQTMRIKEDLGDKAGIAMTLHQLGNIHYQQGDYNQAFEKYSQSLKIEEQLGDKGGIAGTLHNLGRIHEEKKEYKEALRNYLISQQIFKQLKSPNMQVVTDSINRIKKQIGEKKFNKLLSEIQKESGGGK